MIKTFLAHCTPGRALILSLIITILCGAALLGLTPCTVTPLSITDLIFTATSVTCVTGLFTVPLDQFTVYGQIVILLLLQLGGIGIITMSLFLMSLFMDFGLHTQLMARHVLELESWKNIKRILIFSITFTCIVELIGALGIMCVLMPHMPLKWALFLSLFHSVSSFCNAGIPIFSGPVHIYETQPVILALTTALMFIGGLGFITWHEIIQYARSLRTRPRHRFSLHSKIVLYGSFVLFIVSAVLFWLLERNNLFAHLSAHETFSHVIFHAVSFKGTGFLLSYPHILQRASLILILVLGFIGAAPGSTGSGVKITTIAVILAAIRSVFLGRSAVEIRGRQIPSDQVLKATAIISLSILLICFIIFFLCITEPDWKFIDIVSEAYAACTNVGISTGTSATLSMIGKWCIIMGMFVGRLGVVSVILALRLKKTTIHRVFSYPEERIMLG